MVATPGKTWRLVSADGWECVESWPYGRPRVEAGRMRGSGRRGAWTANGIGDEDTAPAGVFAQVDT